MQVLVDKKKLQEIHSEISNNIPILVSKIQNTLQCNVEVATEALMEVLRFLWLIAYSGTSLSPAIKVDNTWHELILCTREYERICTQYFGKFIHHSPGGNEQDNQTKFVKTLTLYALHFGKPPEFFWGDTTMFDVPAQCGFCCN
ncbi:MAG: hypothetical protein JNL36_04030 [Candidatus Kapabacteria bacterium]|nr:hypothetical protein [Candidatus Kapabacteria bacterium]